MCFAVCAKAVCRLGSIVYLQARGFIVMERAAQAVVFVGFQAVVL
jgi:hypothetical protein